jgi:hypothetical protein
MFAKRKPRQEDEPLVPHGLVWQATDTDPSAKTGPEEAPVKRSESQPGSSSATPPNPFPGTAAARPSASLPPPFWHPRKPPENLNLDTPTSGSVPGRLPTRLVPQNATRFAHAEVQGPITQGISKRWSLSQQFRVAASDAISASQKTLTDLAAGLRCHIREFGQRLTGVRQVIQGRPQLTGGPTILMTARIRDVLDSFSNQLSRTLPRARRVSANCQTLGRAYFTKIRAYTNLHSERLNRKMERLNKKLMQFNLARGELSKAPQHTGRMRTGLRIRLAGFPLRLRILFTRTLSEWRLKSETATGDSRLWTSMTMGICTALLALAIVSSARHYGNASLPSHLVHSNDAQTLPQTSSPNIVSSRPASARTGSQTRTPEVRSKRPRPAPAAAQPRSKPRRHSEDDYVARDTYVYYGDSRPKSR